MDTENDSAMQFLANALYVKEEKDKGIKPWAWGVLRDDNKKAYLSMARTMVAAWCEGEREKEAARRHLLDPQDEEDRFEGLPVSKEGM